MKKQILSANWKYTLKAGKDIREAIENEDLPEVIRQLQNGYKELLDEGLIDEYDYDSYTGDFEMYLDEDLEDYDDPEDVVDYELSNFYDLCDGLKVWIPLG